MRKPDCVSINPAALLKSRLPIAFANSGKVMSPLLYMDMASDADSVSWSYSDCVMRISCEFHVSVEC
jgi:hypothetical protein